MPNPKKNSKASKATAAKKPAKKVKKKSSSSSKQLEATAPSVAPVKEEVAAPESVQ